MSKYLENIAVGVAVFILTVAGTIFVMKTNEGPAQGGSSTTNNDLNVKGRFTQGGGIVSIADADGAATLTQKNLADGNIIKLTDPTGYASTTTYTTPASSTLTTILDFVGATAEWTFHNDSTATTALLAAGTGIDFQGYATSSGANSAALTIPVGGFAWVKCQRDAIGTTNLLGDVICLSHISDTAD